MAKSLAFPRIPSFHFFIRLLLFPLVIHPSTFSSDPSTTQPILRRFSTKTSYDASVAMDDLHHWGAHTPPEGTTTPPPGGSGEERCPPVKIVGLLRHGTRYPGEGDVVEARGALGKMRAAVEQEGDVVHGTTELLDRLSAALDRLVRFYLAACAKNILIN